MDTLLSTRTLLDRGHSTAELRRLVAGRQLESVRRGAYLELGRGVEPDRSIEAAHRRLIATTIPLASPDAVISHGSAAVLHELPVWPGALDHVHVSRPGTGGGRTRTNLRTHVTALEPAEAVRLESYAVTGLARTVSDLARTEPIEHALAAADAALRAGLDPADLAEAVERARRWRGAARARRVTSFADPRAESAGESVSRWRIAVAGLPAPTLQHPIEIVGGGVRRSDFAWEQWRTIGEFDGKVKYGRFLRPGESVADAVYREKQREDALRDLGWQVVRWTWAELAHFEIIVDRLRRAFARAR